MDEKVVDCQPTLIYSYTRRQAVEEGVLVKVEPVDGKDTVITANLFADGYEDEYKRKALLKRGSELLKVPDEEDSEALKLREIEKGRIWVIADGDGLTFMKPEDY